MTLNYERATAIKLTRQFLIDLLYSDRTPKVPSEIRNTASLLLKHFPTEYDMEVTSKQCPEIFGSNWLDSCPKSRPNDNQDFYLGC